MSFQRPYSDRGRGSRRPYRANRGRGAPRPTTFHDGPMPSDKYLLQGLVTELVCRLPHPDDGDVGDIGITDVHYLGSYNYVNGPHPTILVPGSPPVWRERSLPYRLPRDTGMSFIDQNGYRMPGYSLYSMFRAIDLLAEENPEDIVVPDWPTVDFVTDRNALRKLWRWANAKESTHDFRVDAQLAGDGTILLNRWERRNREAPPSDVWTYGLNFEFENTFLVEGCERSTGHFRTIRYNFGGLLMVVRSSVDACLEAPPTTHAPTSSANVDNLLSMLSTMSVSPEDTPPPSTPSSSATSDTTSKEPELHVRRAGGIVPQSVLIEMATRSVKRVHQYNWQDVFPQLYLSQTPHHYLAAHDRGTFEVITKRTLGDADLARVEAQSQGGLRKLRRALQQVKDLVVEHGKFSRLSLVFRNGEMQVMERISQSSCLPETVMRRFEV